MHRCDLRQLALNPLRWQLQLQRCLLQRHALFPVLFPSLSPFSGQRFLVNPEELQLLLGLGSAGQLPSLHQN